MLPGVLKVMIDHIFGIFSRNGDPACHALPDIERDIEIEPGLCAALNCFQWNRAVHHIPAFLKSASRQPDARSRMQRGHAPLVMPYGFDQPPFAPSTGSPSRLPCREDCNVPVSSCVCPQERSEENDAA